MAKAVIPRYAVIMTVRRPYPSDLSDARWALIEPALTAWRQERTTRALAFGRPPEHDLRDLLDAILHVDRTGIPWRYLPHDYPPWETVYAYFARWQKEGVFEQLNGLLRRLVRAAEGRALRFPRASYRGATTRSRTSTCEERIRRARN
ncbi:hypothetical protein GCM10025734_00970 [Kitasatospora paranensis]